MAYVSSYAKLENYIETVDQTYVKQSKLNLINLSKKLIKPAVTPQPKVWNEKKLDLDTENRLCKMIEEPMNRAYNRLKEIDAIEDYEFTTMERSREEAHELA